MKTAAKKKPVYVTCDVNQTVVFQQLAVIKKEMLAVQAALADLPEKELGKTEEYVKAAELVIGVVERRKYAEAQRTEAMKEVTELIELVDSWFDPVLEPTKEVEAQLREQLSDFALKLHHEAHGLRRAAARVKDERRCEELLKQANATAPPKVPGIAVKTTAQIEVIDADKIPDKYMVRVPDLKAIQAALESGNEVTGAKLLTGKSIVVTPKNAKKDGE